MNAPLQTAESSALATVSRPQFDLSPQTFEQALTFSGYLADSDLVPKDFKGKPGNCLIAMQWGSELGLKPLQALQNLAIINGRPSLWGDAVIALVRGSALCGWVLETDDGFTATCKVKRRGEPEQLRTFSMDDAKAAGLMGKAGPWTQYPKRMRQMRARAFALRDVFPDVLRGLPVAEEVMDTPTEKHMGPVEVVSAGGAAAAKAYPQDQFDKNLPQWTQVLASGRKTHDEMVEFIETKGMPLTEQQKTALRELPAPKGQATDAAPKVSYAHVADRLHAAKDLEQLADAASLIAAVADPQQRAELSALYERRSADLNA
jgi:hypothetical protein